jgi:hypothetical protein
MFFYYGFDIFYFGSLDFDQVDMGIEWHNY